MTASTRHDGVGLPIAEDAAERASGWSAPLLTTMLAGAPLLLVLGTTRLFASGAPGATVASPTRSLGRAGDATDTPAVGGRDNVLDSPHGAASAKDGAAPGDGDGGFDEDVSAEVERLGEVDAGKVVTGSGLTSDAKDRAERRRRRQRGVDEEGEEGDPYAGLGPMVRHLSAMTKELSEAQRTVGRLTAERDLLRQQLGDDEVPSIGSEAGGARPNKEARMAAKQAERGNLNGTSEIDPDLLNRAAQVGRRRRMIALGVLCVLVGTMVVWRVAGWPSPIDDVSKRGLTGIAYIGPFMNLLIGGFLIYRLMRVGGKAGGWLFPSAEEPKRRRR